MKRIYFVTEGLTDQIVIQGLIEEWLGDEDFTVSRIQPPSSDYAAGLDSNLSEGWKGVLAWCSGQRLGGAAGRDEALRLADGLFIHMDADVAPDPAFKSPPFNGACPPAQSACNPVIGCGIISPHRSAEVCQAMSSSASPPKTWKPGCSARCIPPWRTRMLPSNAIRTRARCSPCKKHRASCGTRMAGCARKRPSTARACPGS
jgi:hypothetical protein